MRFCWAFFQRRWRCSRAHWSRQQNFGRSVRWLVDLWVTPFVFICLVHRTTCFIELCFFHAGKTNRQGSLNQSDREKETDWKDTALRENYWKTGCIRHADMPNQIMLIFPIVLLIWDNNNGEFGTGSGSPWQQAEERVVDSWFSPWRIVYLVLVTRQRQRRFSSVLNLDDITRS